MEKFKKNDLVINLMKIKDKDRNQLAALIGRASRTIERIEKKEHEPTDATLQLISDALNVDRSYWKTGIIKDKQTANVFSEPWRDEAYQKLERQNNYLQSKLDEAMLLIGSLIRKPGKGDGLGFLKALNSKAAAGKAIQMYPEPTELRARA